MRNRIPVTAIIILAVVYVMNGNAVAGGLSLHLACNTSSNNEKTQKLYFHPGQNIARVPEPVCVAVEGQSFAGHVKDAVVVQDKISHELVVRIAFDEVGKARLAEVSYKNPYKQLAWVLDNKIILLATIVHPLNDGVLEIRGLGSEEANKLVHAVKSRN